MPSSALAKLGGVPAKQWSFQQQAAWDALNERAAGRGNSHAVWALLAVESLFYLADVDDHAFVAQDWRGASPEAVDLAYVTAATGNAVSALDRCAAALAEIHHVLNPSGNAVGLSQVRPNPASATKHIAARRDKLSSGALAWIDAVWADSDYRQVLDWRHPLFHAHVGRALHRPVLPGHGSRTIFGGTSARKLVLTARDVADRHVERFFVATIAGGIATPDGATAAFP